MKQFKMPKLIKINKNNFIDDSFNSQENDSQIQICTDVTTIDQSINKVEIQQFVEQVEQVDKPRKQKYTADEFIKVDAQKYAEMSWRDNEMILNGTKYQQRKNNAQKMKINAMMYEVTKVECKANNAISEMKQYENKFYDIKEQQRQIELNNQRQALKEMIDRVDGQIDNAYNVKEETNSMEQSFTPSEMNALLEMGYVRNESLFRQVEQYDEQQFQFNISQLIEVQHNIKRL